MDSKKVQFKIRVRPEVKADMDLFYEIMSNFANNSNGKYRILRYSDFWECIFKMYLEANSDFLRILKQKQTGNEDW
jgi:hypothetical protein